MSQGNSSGDGGIEPDPRKQLDKVPAAKKQAKSTDQLTVDQVCNTRARKVLYDCLLAGLKVSEGAKKAGLNATYARRWVAKSHVNELVVRENKVKTEDLRDEAVRTLVVIMRDTQAKPATKIKAVDTLGKMSGWHSQTTVLEGGNRQRQLTEAERQEARRLAELRFKPEYALMDTHSPMSAQDAVFESANAVQGQGNADVNQAGSGPADALQVPTQAGLTPPGGTPDDPQPSGQPPFPSIERDDSEIFLGAENS